MAYLADFGMVAGIIIIMLILWLLGRKKDRNTSHLILVVIFIVILLTLLGFYSILHDLDTLHIFSYIFFDGTGYLLGPLFYLYIRSHYDDELGFIKRNLFHFLPFFLHLFIFQAPTLYYLGQFPPSLEILDNTYVLHGETYFQAAYLIIYCIASLFLLSKISSKLKLNFSSLKDRDLSWMKYLIVGVMITMSLDTLILFFQSIFGTLEFDFGENTIDGGLITIFSIVSVIIYLGYNGLTQTKVLLPAFIHDPAGGVTDTPKQLYNEEPTPSTVQHHLSNEDEAGIEALKQKLDEVMTHQEPFLEEDLTLGKLAALINTSDKKLSALLNHYLNTTFYDFVNNYRVETFKERLKSGDYDHFTLLALAYDCGFKSKSSFNRIFKKATSMSPSKFKASISAS